MVSRGDSMGLPSFVAGSRLGWEARLCCCLSLSVADLCLSGKWKHRLSGLRLSFQISRWSPSIRFPKVRFVSDSLVDLLPSSRDQRHFREMANTHLKLLQPSL